MYSIILCLVIYLLILFTFIQFKVRGANAFDYGTNLIFVSRNLLKPNSKMHKLFKSPNTIWNQHIKQNAFMRLISIILFPISLTFSIIALILLIIGNDLYFLFDCISFGFLGLNLLLILVLIIWICAEGIKAEKLLNKISNEEYLTLKEQILKIYPNFWI